jgi:sulfhydrogenase subunit alpha
MSHHTFEIENLTKVEARAKLTVEFEGEDIASVNLDVLESSRYFEAFLQGRKYSEATSITQKICGICSVAHTIGALRAVEDAMNVKVSEHTVDLRKLLLYAGQLHSHIVHLYFMAMPDYVGCEDVLEMSEKRHEDVHRGLRLQKLSTEILRVIGGRPVHPVSSVVGGFTDVPTKQRLETVLKKFKEMKKDAMITAKQFMKFKVPLFENNSVQCALIKSKEYPLYDGRIRTLDGIEYEGKDYLDYITEHVRYSSTAMLSRFKGKTMMVGSLARVNTNYKYLSDDAKDILVSSGLRIPSYSPFKNNLAQAIEMVHFVDKGMEITQKLMKERVKKEKIKIKPKAGSGVAVLEAPRGPLYHHYEIDKKGLITHADIITPTSQNIESIENDIKEYMPRVSNKPREKMKLELEKLIRAYDPCISCPTHFLELEIIK